MVSRSYKSRFNRIVCSFLVFLLAFNCVFLGLAVPKAEAFAPVLIEWAAANIAANGGAFAAEQGINPTCESFLEDLQTNDLALYTYLDEAAVAGQLFMSWELSTFTQDWLQKTQNGEITEFSYEESGWDDFGYFTPAVNSGAYPEAFNDLGEYELQVITDPLDRVTKLKIWYFDNAERTHMSYLYICIAEVPGKWQCAMDGIYEDVTYQSNIFTGSNVTFLISFTADKMIVTSPDGDVITDSSEHNVPYYGIEGDVWVYGNPQSILTKYFGQGTMPVADAITLDPERSAPSYITNNIINHYVVPGTGGTALENANNPDLTDDPPPIAYPDTSLDQTILNKILTQIKTLTNTAAAIPAAITKPWTEFWTPAVPVAITFDPLILTGNALTTVFPFCLPWNLARSFTTFNAVRWVPIWELEFDYSPVGAGMVPWVIDLQMWDNIAQVVKAIELVLFDIGLVFATRKLMGGAV